LVVTFGPANFAAVVICCRNPLSMTADDIHALLTTSDRFDFLTNKHLGTPQIKEEM